MEETSTPNPIQFSGVPVSVNQSDVYLYPVKGTHKARDVQQAKYWIKKTKKDQVRYIIVEWKIRDDDEPLNKIPDGALISHMRTELGKKEAYIEELEEKLLQKQEALSSEECTQIKRDVKKEEHYIALKKQISTLNKTLKNLRKNNSELVARILESGNQLPKGISEHDFDDPQSEEGG